MKWNKSLVGQRFGMLLVVKELYKNSSSKYVWLCKCDCGKDRNVVGGELNYGTVSDCGCLLKDIERKSSFPEYRVWADMIQRCTNPKSTNYKHYGLKGIIVCKRWRNSFEAFYEDMGAKTTPKHTIDRKDVMGDYEPANCRWASKFTQVRNTSRNRHLEINGKTMILGDWAREFKISQAALRGYMFTHTWEQAHIHYQERLKSKLMKAQFNIDIKEI